MVKVDLAQASCKDKPTEWWYPLNDKQSIINSRMAVQICQSCPVRVPCLLHALRNETHGIWGGMREAERELERRRLGIQLTPEALASMSQATMRASRRLSKESGTV